MRLVVLLLAFCALLFPATPGAASPEGQLTWAVHISLKERVPVVEVVDPHRVRFRLKEPWPDFMKGKQ